MGVWRALNREPIMGLGPYLNPKAEPLVRGQEGPKAKSFRQPSAKFLLNYLALFSDYFRFYTLPV